MNRDVILWNGDTVRFWTSSGTLIAEVPAEEVAFWLGVRALELAEEKKGEKDNG
jgi:hypothetical protein